MPLIFGAVVSVSLGTASGICFIKSGFCSLINNVADGDISFVELGLVLL